MSRRGPRLTIPTRIFLSIVLVLMSFLVVSGASLYQHERTADRLRLMHEGYLPLAVTIGFLKARQDNSEELLERVLEEGDPGAIDSLVGHASLRPATVRRALNSIESMSRLDPPAEDREALEEIQRSLEAIRHAYAAGDDQFAAISAALERGDIDSAVTILESLHPREETISEQISRVWLSIQSRIASTSQRAAEQEREFLYAVGVLTLLALLVGLIVLFWSQRVLAPLPRLQRRVAAVAGGDLDLAGRIEPARDDEIGRLTVEFESMVDAVGRRDRQLRELQQMQEQIVAGLRAGVVVVDADGLVRSANPAAEEVLGLSEAEVDRPFSECGLSERLEGLDGAIESVAMGGVERASLTAAPMDGDSDEPRFVDVLVTPFGAEKSAGPRRSVLVVADDTTEALRVKQRLIQTERLAAIGRMAAHVTHEVRNPLSSIGLNVELLEEEIEDAGPESKALLRSITREIDRLTGLTEEYLRLARLPIPRLEPEQLGEIVEEVGRFVAREFETSNVTLSVAVEPGLPMVAADESQIRQALLNLLRNARESMPDGGEVRLETSAVDGGLEIRVYDQGEGIPAQKKARIFNLFYSTKDRGTGLGLPLTMQIVSAHGGTIRCEDGPAGGTVFTAWFPPATASERRLPSAVLATEE